MKTILKLTALSAILVILAWGLSSCRDKEQPFLTVDETPIAALAEGGTFSIIVSSNGNWTATVENAEWCTLTINYDTVMVNVVPNTDFTTRGATIKITLKDITKSVHVNQDAMLGGEVPFQPCRCENPLYPYQFQLPKGEAYLFGNHVSQKMVEHIEHKINSYPFPIVTWIISIGNIVYIFIANLNPSSIPGELTMWSFSHWHGEVCNFPDFAREWNIPPDGVKVYFEGRIYSSCLDWGAVVDYVLTYLKKIE